MIMSGLPSELYGEKIPVPEAAANIHKQIVSNLTYLEKSDISSCLEPGFRNLFNDTLLLFEQYQTVVLNHSSIKCRCSRKCCSCCYHWVEDVNSFEAEIITQYIREKIPAKIPSILSRCVEDQAELERLYTFVQKKLSDLHEDEQQIDEIDLLLSVFYQSRRMCPLSDSEGLCMVYEVRPLTCRIYVSFSDPGLCDPAYINDEYIPTYLLNLEEEANEILDRLHFKYQKFKDDTGLRSLLIKYLSIGT